MADKDQKHRKKMVVEEVSSEKPENTDSVPPKIEVPSETPPHVEPGIHEESKPTPQITPQAAATYAPPQAPRTGLNPLVIIVPGIFLLGALLGGIFFYQKSVNKSAEVTPTPTPQAIENQTTTPTPKAEEVDLTKYPISVLNGSGTKGEAGVVQTLLEKAGFEISATGNASNYNYTETVIQVKSDVPEGFITKLKETLGESYKVATKIQPLQDSSENTVVVIVGSSKTE